MRGTTCSRLGAQPDLARLPAQSGGYL